MRSIFICKRIAYEYTPILHKKAYMKTKMHKNGLCTSTKVLHIQIDSQSTSAPKSTRPSAVKEDDKIVSCLSTVKGSLGRTAWFLSAS